MDAKEILKKIKAVFDGAPLPPAPAPIAQAATSANFPVDGGDPVYVDISDDGLSDIDTGDLVYADDALTMPYPDGTYTVTGTTFSFTVAAGLVTTVSGELIPAAPAAAAMPAPAPPVLPMGPTLPQFEAMQTEVTALKAALLKANLLAEKHEKILPDLFELTEKLIELPISAPKALNGAQKDKFDYAAERDQRIELVAQKLKTLKSK